MRNNTVPLLEELHSYDNLRRPIKSADRVAGVIPYLGASGEVDRVDGFTHEGDFLCVSEDGENLRSRQTPIAWVQRGRFWANNHLHVLGGVSLNRLRYLASALAVTDISGYLTGSAQPKLSQASLARVEIPRFAAMEQEAIGEVLGALDDKIAANQLVIRSILDLGQALVMGTDMTRIPIGQIMTITMGTSPKGDDLNEMTSGVPFFQGVRDFGQIFPKNRIYTTHSIRNAKANDILFAVRAPVGRVNLAVDDVSIGRGIAALACSTAPATLFYALMAQEQLWQIFDGGGTVFASVNRKEIEAMTIRWPKDTPAIETVVKPLLDRSVLAEQENTTLTAVRDELLPELMSGRITVKDAEKRVEEEV